MEARGGSHRRRQGRLNHEHVLSPGQRPHFPARVLTRAVLTFVAVDHEISILELLVNLRHLLLIIDNRISTWAEPDHSPFCPGLYLSLLPG